MTGVSSNQGLAQGSFLLPPPITEEGQGALCLALAESFSADSEMHSHVILLDTSLTVVQSWLQL